MLWAFYAKKEAPFGGLLVGVKGDEVVGSGVKGQVEIKQLYIITHLFALRCG